jgi:hypothetical protein
MLKGLDDLGMRSPTKSGGREIEGGGIVSDGLLGTQPWRF